MKCKGINIITIALLTFMISACQKEQTVEMIEGEMAGGATTVFISNSKAFGLPAPNLSSKNMEKHLSGDAAFEVSFVSNPAPKHGGLGPVFNNNACVACHPSDARAGLPSDVNEMSGFFLRISMEGVDEFGGPKPVPGFGTQLQHQSIYGYKPEGRIVRTFTEQSVKLANGTVVHLQMPSYKINDAYTTLPPNILISPRIGMPVFGLGLLEAISEEDILTNADPDDLNKDGISGKANYVWDPISQSVKLGRFGWKAGTPSILVQSAGAYDGDMGLTTSLNPISSTYGQANGDTSLTIDVSDEDLEAVSFYCMTLGVPAGRNFDDPKIIKGRKIFEQINCTACHTPSFTTGVVEGIPEISNQKIYPYTDMLLHDMGDGLADNRNEYLANGHEWKTRPLWGIGLTSITSGHTNFLHDGRARNLTEAILWHDGEAKQSKEDFIMLSTEERENLLSFLNAL